MQTYKKRLIIISTILIVSTFLVGMLAWISLRPIRQSNGFTRTFISAELETVTSVKIPKSITGIIGATSHNIYYRTTDLKYIYVTNTNLGNNRLVNINISVDPNIASVFTTFVDSPNVDVLLNNGPYIIEASLNHDIPKVHKFPSGIFTKAVKLSTSSFIFRGFDTTVKQFRQIFIKGNPTNKLLKRESSVPGSNNLNRITIDGTLCYDQESHLLTFTSFFDNKLYCLDTNLNIVYMSTTIDTTFNQRIDFDKVNSNNSTFLTATSPKRVINYMSRTFQGRLFNLSSLKAENEDQMKYDENWIVDTYDIRTGTSLGSFYIPKYKRERISDFKIFKEAIVVLYKTQLIKYKLPVKIQF